jgi:hypothetical protein
MNSEFSHWMRTPTVRQTVGYSSSWSIATSLISQPAP